MKKTNIEFVKGKKYCLWKGEEMTPSKCIELFGIDGEIEIDKKEFLLVGDVCFCTIQGLHRQLKKMLKEVHVLYAENLIYGNLGKTEEVLEVENYGWIGDIKKIIPYEEIKSKKYNISLLRRFMKDLDTYYNNLH